SLAIADAVRSLDIPVIEVHLTHIFAREAFRHRSYLTPVCKGLIAGLGLDGYRLAVEHLIR
ncbi:MAG: type II 3-dehydroquinate dehydratase, partial [Bacteroidales bacterium]|nr:type II 3-dehydroquinate dehydratase [Bacteroidales bacterium]